MNTERVKRGAILIMAVLLIGFFTGVVSVTAFNDGGFVYQIHVFGQTVTLVDEPAAARVEERLTE